MMSASVTLGRCRAGELVLPVVVVGGASWRELGESRRLDQGGIAQLRIQYSSTRKTLEA